MEQNNQQTAVEWLQELYNSRPDWEQFILIEEFEQAKAMEKEQIENAWDRGQYIGENFSQRIIEPEYENNSEEYYNQTYETE